MSRVFDASQIGANENSLQAASIPSLVGLTAVTVAAWVRTDGQFNENVDGYGTVVSKDVGNSRTSLAIILSSPTFTPGEPPNLNCDIACDPFPTFAGLVSNETIPLNTWTHVAFVWDQISGVMHGYINGVECTYSQHVNSTNPPAVDTGGNLWIGDDIFSGTFNGNIAEVAIWNTVLTPTQLLALVASTSGASSIQSANLVAYYHLCGTSSPEPDASANHNAAVLSSNPPIQGPDSPGFSCSGGSGNSFDSNPLSFIAPDASLLNAKTPKYLPTSNNGLFRVKRVVWVNPAANEDIFTVTDGAGVTLAAGVCVTSSIGLQQTIEVNRLVKDLQVTQLSSGKLLIYVEEE